MALSSIPSRTNNRTLKAKGTGEGWEGDRRPESEVKLGSSRKKVPMKNVDGLGSSARFRAALAAQIPGVLYLVLRGAFGRVG